MYTVENESLTSIADSIRKKAKVTEKLNFPAGFVSAIDGIETGGGSAPVVVEEPGEKDVNFYDYDGRRLFSYTTEEAAALTELPTPPGHEGLVFQEWNYTLDEVKENADAADIGALYTTDDGATRAEIEISAYLDVRLRFTQTKAAGVLIDWGDGKSERSGSANFSSYLHNYESPGAYVVTLTIDDDCTIGLGSNVSCFINISSLSSYAAQNVLHSLYIGDRVTKINEAAFNNHYALQSVSMNKGVTALGKGCFKFSAIEFMTVPNGVSTIPDTAFNACHRLRRVSVPVSVQSLGPYFLYNTPVLKNVHVNASITIIPPYFCGSCAGLERAVFYGKIEALQGMVLGGVYSLKTIDLTHCEAIPTLQSTASFDGVPQDLEILVPAALAEEWKKATNWTRFASKIKGV